MCDKKQGASDEMSVTDSAIQDARGWAECLLNKHWRGVGDTIERAAHEVEQTYGVPASIIQRLRHRDVRDMLLSNWLALKNAYEHQRQRQMRLIEHELQITRTITGPDHPAVVAAAAVVGSPEGIEED